MFVLNAQRIQTHLAFTRLKLPLQALLMYPRKARRPSCKTDQKKEGNGILTSTVSVIDSEKNIEKT